MKIEAVLYSYKNKNLLQVVEALTNNTDNNIVINIYDQHQFDRESSFSHMENVVYNQIFWDHQDSPTEYKAMAIAESNADYFLLISDDILVKSGWDTELISFINNKKIIISGTGMTTLTKRDIFSFKRQTSESGTYAITNIIDRNFIFGKLSDIKKVSYPQKIKYFGEEEMLSVLFSNAGYDVYSTPSGFYTDIMLRTVENLYVPFSKEHGYNIFVSAIKDYAIGDTSKWVLYHGIDPNLLKPLPYQTDDVAYNPSNMTIDVDDIGGKRFTNNLKAIF